MTYVLSSAIPLIGIALCAMALLQFALWSTQSLSLLAHNKKQFELARELIRQQIQKKAPVRQREPESGDGSWIGFRSFRVSKLVNETSRTTSVYLLADDGKPIASFRPGQHITIKFRIPGQSQTVVRCYSLSDRPGLEHYRITVKSVVAPIDKALLQPEPATAAASTESRPNDVVPKPADDGQHESRSRPEFQQPRTGGASHYIHSSLRVGDLVEVKAPAGRFVLDESSPEPIVLLAGGIGITPMISIANHLTFIHSDRQILLIYGVRNSTEHAFKNHIESLVATHANVHVLNMYSHPNPEDSQGSDFHASGFVSVDLLKKILPNPECHFYLCGPPPFMDSIHNGLMNWGVPSSKIFYETFGPASIRKTRQQDAGQPDATTPESSVTFAKSNVNATWDSTSESLLNLAQEHDVAIESGCCAGNCGTCATTIISGNVVYPDLPPVDCEPGKCLVCVAQPNGPLELDA